MIMSYLNSSKIWSNGKTIGIALLLVGEDDKHQKWFCELQVYVEYSVGVDEQPKLQEKHYFWSSMTSPTKR